MGVKKGEKLSEEHKRRIAQGMRGKVLSPESRAKRSAAMKAKWEAMTPDERAALKRKMNEKMRETAKSGSRVEKWIAEYLLKLGIKVELHPTIDDDYEVDLYLPQYDILMEVDGPSHHMVIFSEEALERTKKSDAAKEARMIAGGHKVIRVRFFRNKVSPESCRSFAEYICDKLPKIASMEHDHVMVYDMDSLKDVSDIRKQMFDDGLKQEYNKAVKDEGNNA